MPRLWTSTIETHRRAVRDAVIEAAARLVGRRGIRSVTMSEIAEEAGVGRATLYKYFPDLEAILLAWHEEQIADHLAQLVEAGNRPGTARERLAAVLETYAATRHRSSAHGELGALLHRRPHVRDAERGLREIIGGLISEGAEAGELRDDIQADELAAFCVHALAAATYLPGPGVGRIVGVTLDGLSPSAAARSRTAPRAPRRR